MSLWQRMKALFVTPASTNLQSIPLRLTNANAKSPMECDNPQQAQTQTDQDTSLMRIQGLSPIVQSVRSTLKCIYCHDLWITGITCSCGAVYHDECAEIRCGTLGCGHELRRITKKQKDLLFRRPLPEQPRPTIEDPGPIPQNVINRLNDFILRPTYSSLKDIL